MLNWKGPWAINTGYVKSDAVSHDGSSYVAIDHSKAQPPPLEGKWVLLAKRGANGTDGRSVQARGEYQSNESYAAGDIVLLKDTGNSYIAKANTAPGTPPTNGDYWSILAEGMPKGNDWAAPAVGALSVGLIGFAALTNSSGEKAQSALAKAKGFATEVAKQIYAKIKESIKDGEIRAAIDSAINTSVGETNQPLNGLVTKAIRTGIKSETGPNGMIRNTVNDAVKIALEDGGKVDQKIKRVGNAIHAANTQEVRSLQKQLDEMAQVVRTLEAQIKTSA